MSHKREMAERLAWVAVDWGSSNLRAWAMADDGQVLARGHSDKGMLALTADAYETTLLEVIGDWLPATGRVNVLVCGMAGARQGWREAAYVDVPTRLDELGRGAVQPPVADKRLRVYLLPGLSQRQGPHGGDFDVMRGEETQLAGLVASDTTLSGHICLPGTHSKWACLEDGVVSGFTTYLTGELYQLLASHSVLKHSMGRDDLSDPKCRQAFTTAVRESRDAPQAFSRHLFGLRAADLLDTRLPSGDARRALLAARLSGLAIGLELAGLVGVPGEGLAAGESVTLIGNAALCSRYALALDALGHPAQRVDAEAAVLAGLGLARRFLDTSNSATMNRNP
ncbi:2-dehydro-3-deoxygalactonokinase [Halomonas urumqiensis]|uniref:2-keto-3-deoxy-galactonokinase n=1 Tax=Halomonas urumqiensis TaxID=1684789 RepID=A0A2N7UHJ2_9GAMM|nr:2-dehydro-3-deoxygalactonokinase [Halomonas urumqiensis]PMR79883.1 2-keto-3-deoxy-galactonokinase [Halomonas urumqiensis]PTB02092.1 2-keto-3-deoxy-galactonokinase [Halomonas urumqiensis]